MDKTIRTQKILQLKSEGKTCQQIRDILGVGNKVITQALKENGMSTFRKWDDNMVEQLEKMVLSGYSDLEIAVEFGLKPSSIPNLRYRKTGYRRTTNGGQCDKHGARDFYNIRRKRFE